MGGEEEGRKGGREGMKGGRGGTEGGEEGRPHMKSHYLDYSHSVMIRSRMKTMWMYLLNQTPLSISHHSLIVATPLDVLNEIVAALEY